MSYNRGVKGGGYTAPLFPATIANVNDLQFKPEELTSYEIGFKSEFLNHTLRFNSAAYYYDYHDYQALIYTVTLNQLIKNADATHKGVEAEIDWAPVPAWRFDLGVAYLDAVVKNVPALCCTSSFEAIVGDYTPANAPEWSGNAMIRYTLPLGSANLAFQVDGTYLSKFWFNLGDAPAVQQDAYGVANARINYTGAGDKYRGGRLAREHLQQALCGDGFRQHRASTGWRSAIRACRAGSRSHVEYRF